MATPMEGVDVGGEQLHLFLPRKDFGRLFLGPSEHPLMFTGAAASIRWLHSLKQLFLLASSCQVGPCDFEPLFVGVPRSGLLAGKCHLTAGKLQVHTTCSNFRHPSTSPLYIQGSKQPCRCMPLQGFSQSKTGILRLFLRAGDIQPD